MHRIKRLISTTAIISAATLGWGGSRTRLLRLPG
jgi:hypothetical protein